MKWCRNNQQQNIPMKCKYMVKNLFERSQQHVFFVETCELSEHPMISQYSSQLIHFTCMLAFF